MSHPTDGPAARFPQRPEPARPDPLASQERPAEGAGAQAATAAGSRVEGAKDRRRSRDSILTAARACFAEYGYEGATVKRLEEATGLSRGAIFHHFRDKDDLFLSLAREDSAAMAELASREGLVQVMRRLIDSPAEVQFLATRLEIARRLRTDVHFRGEWRDQQIAVDQAVQARLHSQRVSGRMRTDLPEDVVATYLDVMLEGLIARMAAGLPTTHLSQVLDLVEESVRQQ